MFLFLLNFQDEEEFLKSLDQNVHNHNNNNINENEEKVDFKNVLGLKILYCKTILSHYLMSCVTK